MTSTATKSQARLEREIEDNDLAEFARGAEKYAPLKRARRAYVVEAILRERGVATAGADDDALVALARAELARSATASALAQVERPLLGRGTITEEQARSMPRFEFIAHWLAVVTRKKANRGPLGYQVKRVGKSWRVVSPVGGGTVAYETTDPALLFDYARRGELGSEIRRAEEFRGLAYERVAR
jgi:hypothetical protein